MSGWTWQAYVGVFGGLGVFALFAVPILIVQYRRYGRPNAARLIGALATSVYAVAVVAYTLLPLPDPVTACRRGGTTAQPVPFHFVADIAGIADRVGAIGALRGWVTLQVVFNVVLFVPLGLLVRRFLSTGVLGSTLIGFGVSLLIEATQFTGNWGLYRCSYRVADVDDLIANTAGALVGAALAPALLFWVPAPRDLARGRQHPRPVTVWRRWSGMAIDCFTLTSASFLLATVLTILPAVIAHRQPVTLPAWLDALSTAVVAVAVFYLPPLRGSGASFGQRVVWLEPRWPAAKPGTRRRRLLRASVTGGAYSLGLVAVALLPDGSPALLLAAGFSIWTAVCVLLVPLTPGFRGISALVSNAVMADSRSQRDSAGAAMPSAGPSVGSTS